MTDRRTPIAFASKSWRGSSPGYSLVELMAFMAVMVTLAAFIMPFTRGSINAMNLTSDARNLMSAVSLAKMRAAATFSKARVYVDLGARTYQVERWQKNTNSWITEGVVKPLAANVNFGWGSIGAPPPNTQPAIGQATQCLTAAGVAIANTACVVFNSRGIPVDNIGVPVASDAYYLSDGATVFGVTVSTGGMVQLWRSNLSGGSWSLN
jgi:type II secretory pathway pseudopilin PulG